MYNDKGQVAFEDKKICFGRTDTPTIRNIKFAIVYNVIGHSPKTLQNSAFKIFVNNVSTKEKYI